jgi:transposase
VRTAQLFVATLGASSYTFAEATWTQSLPDWIASHVRAFGFFGGVTAQIVSDNLKAGVTKACFYDPVINRTYGDLAAHYDTAVLPARPHKPKDKSKVEGAVLLVERWILAWLRNRQFFSLEDVNAAIRPLLDRLNDKVSRHLGASRRQLFEQLDKHALKPLPVAPYIYAEWKKCRAGLDYHIAIDRHYYSVPHQLLKKELWARITARTVEVFHIGTRVASHVRTSGNGQHSTQRDHMPAHHKFREDWTPQRIQAWAARVGPNVAIFAEVVMRDRKHPEQGYRTCLGVIRLADRFGRDRLDAACRRALEINARSYSSVQSILKNGLDSRPHTRATEQPAITHINIRGADYFH